MTPFLLRIALAGVTFTVVLGFPSKATPYNSENALNAGPESCNDPAGPARFF
jgi:hypothetical protein